MVFPNSLTIARLGRMVDENEAAGAADATFLAFE